MFSREKISIKNNKELIINLVAPSQNLTKRAERYTLLDPFFGSGTIIMEALLLGYRVVGVDIDPLAWLIVKETSDRKFDFSWRLFLSNLVY